jgi:proline iminopeptidase
MNVTTFEPSSVQNGLAIYRLGEGKPVLLMPGPHRFQQPGDGSSAPLIKGLIGLEYQVISFDPPASGRSTRLAQLGMAEMLECTNEALDVCGITQPVHALGHSMGGLALLAYAVDCPDRVDRLVFVGTGSAGQEYMTSAGALWNRSHPHFPRLALLGICSSILPTLAMQKSLMNFVRRESFVDRTHVHPARISLPDWFSKKNARPEWHRIAQELDYRPRLGEIRLPALILCGRHDPQYPPACSERLARGIRRSHLIWFEQSGHYPFIEEPRLFWNAVRRFYEEDNTDD